MENPIITMRSSLGLSQRELAEELSVSQQFIQRLELGQAARLSNVVGDFYDYRITKAERTDILADLLQYAGDEGRSVPKHYIPGSGFWTEASRTTVSLYDLWVRLVRASLPDLSSVYADLVFDPRFPRGNQQNARQVIERLCSILAISEDYEANQRVYELATLLKIHPFILTSFVKRAERSVGLPPTLIHALEATKK